MILEHLKSGKTITDKEARDLYGIARCAARISELRNQGHIPIDGRFITVEKRGGEKARVMEYKLSEDYCNV